MSNHLRKARQESHLSLVRAVATVVMVVGVGTLAFSQAAQQTTPPVRNDMIH